MVEAHGLSLGLVDATTGQRLDERVDAAGTTWVKGEPGDNFWVAVACDRWSKDLDTLVVKVCVDGTFIGYLASLPLGTSNLGPLKPGQTTSGPAITYAFKFLRHEASHNDADEAAPPPAGSVTASFYRAESTKEVHESTTRSGAWVGQGGGGSSSAHKKEQSALHAGVGEAVGAMRFGTNRVTVKEKLATLALRYTTDFGMAVRGLYQAHEVGGAPAPKRAKAA